MRHSNFITNQNQLLSEISNKIMPATKNLDILVGYFYFSGFREVYENLTDKRVRILVGMDIGTDINNKAVEINADQKNASISSQRQKYHEDLRRVINETEEFDTPGITKAWKVFIEKISNGSLEIHKTSQSNHSKVYLFHHQESQKTLSGSDGIVITGSSNLSYSGMSGRHEANVILRDSNDFDEASKFFEELWSESIELVSQNNFDKFKAEVGDKIWIDNNANPFAMCLRVLDEYFGVGDSRIKTAGQINKDYSDLQYQTDAVKRALQIIENHNGCIVADVVGLGKSIIGSVIAHNLELKTVIIAPPHLQDQWKEYKRVFDFDAEVYSSGNIQHAFETESKFLGKKLIILDEAHKYRNDLTEDYGLLHQICQNNKVVLLTATPFNNSPKDIYNLIKLFQVPGRSTIKTVDNLAARFESLIAKYKKIATKKLIDQKDAQEIASISNELKLMIEPLVIRRSRLDLEYITEYKKDLESKGISFAKIVDPDLVEYDLGDIYPVYVKTLSLLCPVNEKDGFIGAKYTPILYLKDIEKYRKNFEEKFGTDFDFIRLSQKNLASMMKTLLVKRFESSIFAFRSTLENMISYHQNTLDWYNKLGLVAIYKKGQLPSADVILNSTDDKVDSSVFEIDKTTAIEDNLKALRAKGLETIDKSNIKIEFAKEVEKDLSTLKTIQELWFGTSPIVHDPKIDSLITQIQYHQTKNKDRKIVIFSEYADTIDYLEIKLKEDFRVIKYTSSIAKPELKETVRQNFDAGLPLDQQKNDFDIIVATDAISEGYNLHRAGLVINYDIPFNPTRVIQRVGRINRINKKVFDELFIINFFPSLVGKKEYRVESLATLKMSMIHSLLGEDAKVLKSDEVGDLKSFLNKEFTDKQNESEQISWDTKYQNILREHKSSNSEQYQLSQTLPTKSRTARKVYIPQEFQDIEKGIFETSKGLLIFVKQKNNFVFKLQIQDGTVHNLTPEQGIGIFEAELLESPYPLSPSFEDQYQLLKLELNKTKNIIKLDKGDMDTLAILKALKSTLAKEPYLDDLIKIIQEYKGLPDGVMKQIRAIKDFRDVEGALSKIKKIVSISYIQNIFQTANNHSNPETILFAQEIL
jgi:superfamily II DNA or RNA helicase